MQNTAEYQSLKKKAGVQSVVLDVACLDAFEKLGRFPHLDEIPTSNSEQYIKEQLKIKKNGSTKINHILETTNSNTIEIASQKLNNEYRDKEIEITPIVDEAIVDIRTRPTEMPTNIETIYTPDTDISGAIIIGNALNKLDKIYGIKVHEVSDADLASAQWSHLMPQDRFVNAFIYNGEIYINTDKASPDAKIHEMLHLLVGSMRFSNPQLYLQLINSAQQLPNYQKLAQQFINKSQNDLNEEIIISELGKYFSGMNSELNMLDSKTQYEITYNVRRVLDSILMGSISTKAMSNALLFNSTLREVVEATNSDIMTNTFHGFLDFAQIHRKLNNLKSDLLRKNELQEFC